MSLTRNANQNQEIAFLQKQLDQNHKKARLDHVSRRKKCVKNVERIKKMNGFFSVFGKKYETNTRKKTSLRKA